jgi:hypothetical protein
MKYEEILVKAITLCSAHRSIERFLKMPKFAHAHKLASGDALDKLFKLIVNADSDGVERWLKDQLQSSLEEMPMRRLREIGKENYIPYASILSRGELVRKLIQIKYEPNRVDEGRNTQSRSDGGEVRSSDVPKDEEIKGGG